MNVGRAYRGMLLMGLLSIATVAMVATLCGGVDISEEYPVADTDEDEDSPAIAIDPDGNFHILYEVYDFDTHTSALYYRKVDPTGSTLVDPTTLSLSSLEYVAQYDIAVGPSDRVHVVFSAVLPDSPYDLYYTQLSIDGNTKVAARTIYTSADDSVEPVIDIDMMGNVYVSWTTWNPFTIMWMKLTSSGTVAVSAMEVVGDLPGDEAVVSPAIGVSATGTSYLVWNHVSNINSQFFDMTVHFATVSSNGLIEVTDTEVLSSPVIDYSNLEADLDSQERLHLTVMARDRVRGDYIYYARLDPSGNVVDERTIDDPVLGDAWHPDIVVSPVDDVYLVYQKMPNPYIGNWNIYMSVYWHDEGRWEDDLQLTQNDVSQSPSVAASRDLAGIAFGYRHSDVYLVTAGEVQANDPPVASLSFSPSDIQVKEGVTFYGDESYDPDLEDWVEEYRFEYGDGQGSGWTASSSVTHSYGEAGTYTASLWVRDNRGLECEGPSTATVVVKEGTTNRPPAAVLSASPTTVDVGRTVTFNGDSSSDPDGVVQSWRFTFGDGAGTGWVDTSVVTHAYDTAGVFRATLQVRDDEGAVSENTASVQVTAVETNSPPTATIVSITPNPATSGEDVAFTGTGEDADGTIAKYSWESDLDGILSAEGSFTSNVLQVGIHTISFQVQDDDGEWSVAATATLEVRANLAPTLADLTDLPGKVHTDTKVAFRVSYTDAEGDEPTTARLMVSAPNKEGFDPRPLEEVDTSDGDVTDGREYTLSLKLGKAGKWKYYFVFENTKSPKRQTPVKEVVVKERSSSVPGPGPGAVVGIVALAASATVLTLSRGRRGA